MGGGEKSTLPCTVILLLVKLLPIKNVNKKKEKEMINTCCNHHFCIKSMSVRPTNFMKKYKSGWTWMETETLLVHGDIELRGSYCSLFSL